jgi:P27 family predicted phage terminase small subunit
VTRHKRRAHEPVAEGELAAVAPPAWLSDNQRRLWGELLADAPKGLLRRADQRLFSEYVVLVDYFERAAQAQNELDAGSSAALLMRSQQTASVSANVRVVTRLVPLLNQLQSELGYSPTARARLGVPAPPQTIEARPDRLAELRTFPVIVGGVKQSRGVRGK